MGCARIDLNSGHFIRLAGQVLYCKQFEFVRFPPVSRNEFGEGGVAPSFHKRRRQA
jgi:hypothetical protein